MIERMDSRTPISSKWPSILFAHLYVVFFFDWSHMLSSARPMRYSHSFSVSFLASFLSSAVNVGSYLASFFFSSFLFIKRYCNPKGNDCNEHVPSVP